MSFDDRIRGTLGAASESMPTRRSDFNDIMSRGRRYRARTMAMTTSLGIVAGIGAIAATAWVVGALNTAPDPAELVPAPPITTTTATVPPNSTATSQPPNTSSTTTTEPVAVPDPDLGLVVVAGEGVLYLEGGQKTLLVAGYVQAAYPDLAGGLVFQPSGWEYSPDIYRLPAGGGEPELLVSDNEGEFLSLKGTAIIDGDPVVLYTVKWDDVDGLFTRDLYLLNLETGRHLKTVTDLDRDVYGISVGSDMLAIEVADAVYPGENHDENHDIAFFTFDGDPVDVAYDPDGTGGPIGCEFFEGTCPHSPRYTPSGNGFAYIEPDNTLVWIEAATGAVVHRTPIPANAWLVAVSATSALLSLAEETLVVDLGTGVTETIDVVLISTGASFVTAPLALGGEPIQVADLPRWPGGRINGLPDGVSLLVTTDDGVWSVTATLVEPLVLSSDVRRAVSDLEGGVVYTTADSIVWQPADGPVVEIASNPGGRIVLGTVANIDGQRSLLYVIDQEIWLVRLSDLAKSVWTEVTADEYVFSLSAAGPTIGFMGGYTYRFETTFKDASGNPVEEPFDPEPAEGCHPFDDWCVGEMLLNSENDTLAYSWILAGMDQDAAIHILDRGTGATTKIPVPGFVQLHDYHGDYATAAIHTSGFSEPVLIDVAAGTSTPMELIGMGKIRHVSIAR